MAKDVTTYTLKQAMAAKVEDHIEISVEAEDGSLRMLIGGVHGRNEPADIIEAV